MKRNYFFLFVFICNLSYGQNTSNGVLLNKLITGAVDSIDQIGITKPDILEGLCDIINSQRVNRKINIWYSSAATDSFWMSRNGAIDLNKQLYASIAFKCLYWIELVSHDIDTGYSNFVRIESIKTRKTVYDYFMDSGSLVKLNSADVQAIFNYFKIWFNSYKSRGLEFIKLNKPSLLPSKYRFVHFSPYASPSHRDELSVTK